MQSGTFGSYPFHRSWLASSVSKRKRDDLNGAGSNEGPVTPAKAKCQPMLPAKAIDGGFDEWHASAMHSSMTVRKTALFVPAAHLLFLLFTAKVIASPNERPVERLKTWEVFELSMTAERHTENPYAEIPVAGGDDMVAVTFTGASGPAQGKEIRVIGFWDGGQTWKARFASPEAGAWNYRSSSTDPGLDEVTGKLVVADWRDEEKESNPARRGLIKVMEDGPQPGRYFKYADGTPFLWVADTWWNWTKREIHFSTYTSMVDDRAAKGYTLGQLFVAANGWGRSSSLLDESYTQLDVEHMRKVDRMIAYANSKGLTVWVHGWWARENLENTAGEEKMKRWWRYLVHRLGAYNVIWVPGGEYNLANYGGLGLEFWKDLGRMIDAEDPYERIIGMHPTPPNWSGGAEAPQWSTAEVLHDEPWLDYNQSQVGHGRMANEMIPDVVSEAYSMEPAKPIVVTEPWYEFVEGNPTGRDVRFGAWTALLSGAAGHTYGGGHVWLAHVPESPAGGGPWPLQKEFEPDTLDYEGAVSMGHMADFFQTVNWWKMAPHPNLVREYPDKYCLAAPGEEYVVYLRWGGTVKIDLSAASEHDRFEYSFFDPGTGEYRGADEVKGGAIRFFSAPGGYPGSEAFTDWVLRIRRR